MAQVYESEFPYIINKAVLSNDQMTQIDKYSQKYYNKSEDFIMKEIARVKSQVSPTIIKQYVNNLDHLYKMEGVFAEDTKNKINRVKSILSNPSRNPRRYPNPRQPVNPVEPENPGCVEDLACGGVALLLWFLVLVAIWRKPCYRRPYRKPPCEPNPCD